MAEVVIPRIEHGTPPLPPVCIRCGRPAELRLLRFFLSWPTWLPVLLFAPGGILWMMLAFRLRGDWVRTRIPVCRAHRRHWWASDLVMAGAVAWMLAWTAAQTFGVTVQGSAGVWGVTALGVTGLVWWFGFVVVQELIIRPAAMDRTALRLIGVSAEFALAVESVPSCCGCGYDLRGNTSGRCPECGLATPAGLP